ncbi:conserved hypothetical protein [Burkholderiales bacterium 8X]|nr:conserved hypothetical protein [Burkholderiales bacterium 8X]
MGKDPAAMPPHRAIRLPGLHAYPGAISVAAGETIGFHVSSSVPYRFSLCRLGPDPDDASQDPVLLGPTDHAAQVQPIHPGSYVLVERGLPPGPLPLFSLECWVMPWGFGQRQAILTQGGEEAGLRLVIEADGRLVFECVAAGRNGGGASLAGPRLVERQWAHVVAVIDAGEMRLWIDGQLVASESGHAEATIAPGPLRLGASSIEGRAEQFLDADLAMPVLYRRALQADEILRRFEQKALVLPEGGEVLACWPLNEPQGDRVSDVSGHERHGRIVNHATRMIVGPAFDPAAVPRFSGGDYEPTGDDLRGHGLRFASDDMVDCGWSETHRAAIPGDARPGIYVGRFDLFEDGKAIRYDVSFVVRKAPSTAPAPILVLCATNSWRAYASSPFARHHAGPAAWPRRAAPRPNSHPEAPDYNHYTPHRKGQPTYYAGLRMPWPSASPDAFYAPEGSGFSHGPRLERSLHAWLDATGYAYDVIADLDLHRDPALLGAYRTVIINGHSEYWSAPAVEGLDRYLCNGGTAIVLSGNTMYWRVSFDDDGTVMEQRKTLTPSDPGAHEEKHAAPGGRHGEQYHGHDGRRGGLWRFNDRSSSEVIGLETAGWAFADAEDFGVYRVREGGHFLFHEPNETGLEAGDTFGHGPGGSLPRAIGHEWDLTIATLRRMTHAVPAGAELPPDPVGIQVIAEGVRRVPGRMDAYLDFFEHATHSLDGLSAEMIYWERPQGGRVFNAGAVGASWVLGVDEKFGRLLRNVLHHFGVTPS